ncbi:MAG: hypothetical protein D6738_09485 [Acidobacteria bacterium]|nr:MAG: hypothetical protein D6738_09485 [Acidobacteriota bacterium]
MSGRPVLGAWRPVRGSRAVMLLQAAALVVASLPATGVFAVLAGGPARAPVLVEAARPLSWAALLRMLPGVLPAWAGLALSGVGVMFLATLVLRPGALAVLAAAERGTPVPRPARAVLAEGVRWIGPMLRVALVTALLIALGAALVGRAFGALSLHGARAGWSDLRLDVVLPLLRLAALGVVVALAGALAAMTRVVLVADRRRLVRSALPIAARVLRGAPGGALVFPVVLHGVVAGLGLVVLGWWRQHPPAGAGAAALRVVLLALLVALQAFGWHWMLRAGLRVYALPRFEPLRVRLDRPWNLRRRALAALRRRRAR